MTVHAIDLGRAAARVRGDSMVWGVVQGCDGAPDRWILFDAVDIEAETIPETGRKCIVLHEVHPMPERVLDFPRKGREKR